MRFYFLFFLSILIISCKPIYSTTEFNLANIPKAPNYANSISWACFPNKYPVSLENLTEKYQKKDADVFYLYPTLLLDKKDNSWNANIWNNKFRDEVITKAIFYQASAWVKSANLYAPFYRQAHYRIFDERYTDQGKQAWEIAYTDIKRSFKYYLKNYNNGKPIIIASHSQGSLHAKRLIQEFFDNKPLQDKLVGAYLIGTSIKENEFKNIKPMKFKDEIGGFVSWNSYKYGKYPKKYDSWFKGSVSSNPITWNKNEEGKIFSHKGLLYDDKKVYPQSVSVKVIDGLLWTTLPIVPKRILMSYIKNYHFADINLFWKDIEENSVLRVKNWLKEYKKQTL